MQRGLASLLPQRKGGVSFTTRAPAAQQPQPTVAAAPPASEPSAAASPLPNIAESTDDQGLPVQQSTMAAAAAASPVDGVPAAVGHDDAAEADPLEAFMSGIEAQLATQPAKKVRVDGSATSSGAQATAAGSAAGGQASGSGFIAQRMDDEDDGPEYDTRLDSRAPAPPRGTASKSAQLASGRAAGRAGPGARPGYGDDVDDDDEAEDDGTGQLHGRRIESLESILPVVEHGQWQYPTVTRRTAATRASGGAGAQSVAAWTENGRETRAELGITAVVESSGTPSAAPPAIPDPVRSFMHLGLDGHSCWAALVAVMAGQGWEAPTAVQAQALPALLASWDVLGLAATGSGKTLAYALPAVVHAWLNRRAGYPACKARQGKDTAGNNTADGRWAEAPSPISLVLAPTRELALQVHDVVRKLARAAGLTSVVLVGGAGKWAQACSISDAVGADDTAPHIVVATPGRLLDHCRDGVLSLCRVSYLCLDEADRLLDLGFGPQVRAVCEAVRPDRQVALFSATWSRKVQSLASSLLTSGRAVLRIATGSGPVGSTSGGSTATIHQRLFAVEPSDKWQWVEAQLPGLMRDASQLALGPAEPHAGPVSNPGSSAGVPRPKALVFVSSKQAADQLTASINGSVAIRTALGIHPAGRAARALHGGQLQHEREESINAFRTHAVPLLVATDVASRGLDIPDVSLVLSYDAARSLETHVHRVGRTGRLRAGTDAAGAETRPGLAVTLLSHASGDAPLAAALVESLGAADEAPDSSSSSSMGGTWDGQAEAHGPHLIAPEVRHLATAAGQGGRRYKGASQWQGLGSGSHQPPQGPGNSVSSFLHVHRPQGHTHGMPATHDHGSLSSARPGVRGPLGLVAASSPTAGLSVVPAEIARPPPVPAAWPVAPSNAASDGRGQHVAASEGQPRKRTRWGTDEPQPQVPAAYMAPVAAPVVLPAGLGVLGQLVLGSAGPTGHPSQARQTALPQAPLAASRALYQSGMRY